MNQRPGLVLLGLLAPAGAACFLFFTGATVPAAKAGTGRSREKKGCQGPGGDEVAA